ncbi:MAG TPA: M56 family metallopeptidase [Tepidisphaeraceae bacterium]|jgi:beta-lactamase regulating signal transducer with metallopeptidase domain
MGISNVELTPIAYRIGWTLVDSLWQGAVVAMVLGFALAVMRRRSAQARYVASLAALATILAAAGVTFRALGPIVETPPPRGAPQVPHASPAESHPIAARFGPPESLVIPSVKNADQPGSHETKPAVIPPPGPRPLVERATARVEPMLPWLTIAWAAGVLTLSLWHAGGWVAAQRLRVLGIQPPSDETMRLTGALCARLGLRTPVRVVISMLAQTPMVIGCLRPVVLLPAAIVTGLTPGQLEGILAHELAHIRRHDYLVNLFQVLAETLLFYHPAVWWISRRIRLEREQCCDEIAVRACGDRCAYAESLAALAEVRLNAVLALAARGSGRGELLARIRRILRMDDVVGPTHAGRGIVAAMIVAALLAAALPLALLCAAPTTSSPVLHGAAEPAHATDGTGRAPATSRPSAGDSAQVIVPPPRQLDVLLVTDGNYFLERAIQNMHLKSPDILQPASYENRKPANYDVILFDRYTPTYLPRAGNFVYFGSVPPPSPGPGQKITAANDASGKPVLLADQELLDWQRDNPMLKDLALNQLYVAQSLKLNVPLDALTLINGRKGPLAVLARDGKRTNLVIGFDVLQSNWPFEPSFPVFLHSALRWLMNEEAAPADGSPAAHEPARAAMPTTTSSAPPRLQFRVEPKPGEGGETTDELKDPVSGKSYRFRKDSVLSEADVKAAREERSQNGELAVDVEFTDAGAAKILAVTSANLNRRMAILFDGRVLSMPVIRAAISRAAVITSGFNGMTPKEAKALVEAIESSRHPAGPATGPATAPATRQAAAFTADCVLSGIVDGQRKALATPSFSLHAGSDIRFVYTGKPPVIIERSPGKEEGIAAEFRADEQPDGKVRIFCRIQQRGADGVEGDETLLRAHIQQLLETERKLDDAKALFAEAQRDLDRRRVGLSGFQPYTLEEICRVDPTLLAKVNARNEQATTYDFLRTKYGTNYPSTKEALELLEIRKRDVEESAKRFNDQFLISAREDGGPGRVISKDLSKLRSLVDNWQKRVDTETAVVNKLAHAGGSETGQIVKLGEPVAVELADGTRLEVSVRATSHPR